MHDGTFRMLGRDLSVPLVTMCDGFLQFADAFIKMRIRDFFLSHFRVGQGFLGMTDNGIGMAHPAMFGRFFRVRNRFMNVLIPIGERRRNRQYTRHRHQQSGKKKFLRHSTPPH